MQTPQQIKEKISKMSPKIKDVAFSPELFDIVEKISSKNSLNNTQSKALSDLVFEALVNLEDTEYLSSNISHYLGDDQILNQKILNEAEGDILKNLDNIYYQINQNIEADELETVGGQSKNFNQQEQTKPVNKVGQEFEQIILNQARAMQPAKPVDSGIMNHELRIKQENQEPKAQISVPNYAKGQDPYREPIE